MPDDLMGRLGRESLRKIRQLGESVVWAARQPRLWSYLISDRRPWRIGYVEYKERILRRVLMDNALMQVFREGSPLPLGYGYRVDARLVEIPWALSHLTASKTRLLDAGSSLNHEYVLSARNLSNKSITILTLAPEPRCYWEQGISYVFWDLRHALFLGDLFDEIVCISTIEHVGMDNSRYTPQRSTSAERRPDDYLDVVGELRRILAPGGKLLITFPFGLAEDHGWFQQFDESATDRLIEAFDPKRYSETIFKYDPDGWRLSNREGCAGSKFFDVNTSKYFDRTSRVDFPDDYPAGERAVACLELLK